MPWWAASIVANVAIAFIEYINRVGGHDGFFDTLKLTALPIFIAQWGLWGAWSGAPSLMTAWVFFLSGNIILRVITSQCILGELISPTVAAGIVLALSGAYLVKVG